MGSGVIYRGQIDGVAPGAIDAPATPGDFATALASASRANLATVISGAGTKLQWGRPPERVDLLLSTARLNRILAHRHGDLTATIQAGASLTDVNHQLAAKGQWLPIDTAFEAATIGGLVATNDAGPLRHRYGTPRDLLIGITLALTDGRLVKAGGHVVKNVAGYDLGRLMSGSFGTLAAIVDATFKLLPVPATSQTVVARFADGAALAAAAAALAATDLEPLASDLHVTPAAGDYWLLVRFATSPAATEAQVAAARPLLGGSTGTVHGKDETLLWRDHREELWRRPGAIVRLSWMPASLGAVLALIDTAARKSGIATEFVGRAAVGAGVLRMDGDDGAQVQMIQALRGRADVVGNLVVLRASRALKEQVDVWGSAGTLDPVYRSLKQTFDPAGMLNAGRGPV
jgi:glycolate oxidase FAD binding subunit